MVKQKIIGRKGKGVKNREVDAIASRAKAGDPEAFRQLLEVLDDYIKVMAQNFMDGSMKDDVAQELRLLLWKVLRPWSPEKAHLRAYFVGAAKKHLWRLKKKLERFQTVPLEDEDVWED